MLVTLRKGNPSILSSYLASLNIHYVFVYTCRLRDFSEWGQCQVLKLLQRYHPASEDELFDMLVCDLIKTLFLLISSWEIL